MPVRLCHTLWVSCSGPLGPIVGGRAVPAFQLEFPPSAAASMRLLLCNFFFFCFFSLLSRVGVLQSEPSHRFRMCAHDLLIHALRGRRSLGPRHLLLCDKCNHRLVRDEQHFVSFAPSFSPSGIHFPIFCMLPAVQGSCFLPPAVPSLRLSSRTT